MNRSNNLLFIGMQESGKTTYLAALWHYVNSEKKEKILYLSTLANTENEYLEKIKEEWIKCSPVTRTYMKDKTEKVVMHLIESQSGEEINIHIPDVAGEVYNDHFKSREISMEYDEVLKQTNGILLFVNPNDEKNTTKFIADASQLEAKYLESDSGEIKSAAFTNWSEEYTSNQVKLVEELQFILTRRKDLDNLKISVVVSRWDTIEDIDSSFLPKDWVQNYLPLLYQYLDSNNHIFICNYFGVSAQGGDYKKDGVKNSLLRKEPHDRPLVKQDKNLVNDITLPIIGTTVNENRS